VSRRSRHRLPVRHERVDGSGVGSRGPVAGHQLGQLAVVLPDRGLGLLLGGDVQAGVVRQQIHVGLHRRPLHLGERPQGLDLHRVHRPHLAGG